MALNLGVMSAAVTLDDSDYRNKLSGMEQSSNNTFKKIAAMAGTYLSARMISGFVADCIKSYSDLEEATNKFDVVFQGLTEKSQKYLEQLKAEFGQSDFSAKELLSGSGDILTGLGLDREQALDFSMLAAKLGADLASFTNYAGGAKGATEALTKAMLGEAEQAKSLGIVIRQDSDEYKEMLKQAMTTGLAIEEGGKKSYASTLQQAKALVALRTAYQQSPNAIGDFMRTQDSLANQSRILTNNYTDLKQKIGEEFSGAGAQGLGTLNELLKSINETEPATLRLVASVGALSAGFLVLSKTGVLASLNNIPKSVANITATAEATAVSTSEKAKELATEASTANRIKLESKRHLVEIRNAHVEATAVVKSEAQKLAAIKARVAQSQNPQELKINQKELQLQQKAFDEQVKQAKKLKNEVASAQKSYADNAKLSTTANEKLADATAVASKAQNNLVKASTTAGKAQAVLSAGLNRTKIALNGLATAIGPVGAVMLALGACYVVYQRIMAENQAFYDKEISYASKRIQKNKDKIQANQELRNSERQNLTFLEEMSKHETLSRSSQEESKKIIEQLTARYGSLGISIDEATGKIIVATGAWDKLNEVQAREHGKELVESVNSASAEKTSLLNKLNREVGDFYVDIPLYTGVAETALGIGGLLGASDDWKEEKRSKLYENDYNREITQIAKIQNSQEQLKAIESLRNKLNTEGGSDKELEIAEQLIAATQEEIKQKKALSEFNESKKINSNADEKTKAQAEQNALNKLQDTRWNNKYSDNDDAEKASMLEAKLVELNKKRQDLINSGTKENEMSKDQLELVSQIEAVERKRNELKKSSANSFAEEASRYADYLAKRKSSKQEKALESQISKLQNSGDKAGADKLISAQYKSAKNSAEKLQKDYERIVKDAYADGIKTAKESNLIAKAREAMEEGFRQQDKWSERLGGEQEKQQEQSQQMGNWSAEVLASMLGGASTTEKNIEKYNKEQVRLARVAQETLEKISSGTTTLYYSS